MFKLGRLLFVFTILLILAACGNGDKPGVELPMSSKIPNFEAVNQDGDAFVTDDYLGKWTIVDFIFTNCTTVCLPMSLNMSQLQDDVKEAGLENIQFVSYSVDPDFDTPEVLSEYAVDYGADTSNWHFLTGYDFQSVKELSIKTFKLLVQEPTPGEDQVSHSTRFSLVDPDGKVVNSYNGGYEDQMDLLLDDLNILVK